MSVSTFLDAIARVGAFGARWDDDFYDRLNHKYSVVLLAIYAVLVSTKQYVGDPIVCWCPGSFSGVMIDYAHQICWISNTYYLPESRAPLTLSEPREHVLTYYQWIPMILLLQAFLFLVPHVVWRLYGGRSGLDVNRLVELVSAADNVNPEVRDRTVKCVARHIDRSLLFQKYFKTDRCSTALKRVAHQCCCCVAFGRGYGNYAVALYLFTKVLYIGNAVGQLWLLSSLLGAKFQLYGYQVVRAVWSGNDGGSWTSKIFPRVTMCDFTIRQFSNIQPYTVQCVLPINLFNEKVYTFIWFWLVLVSAASTVGLIQWLASLFANSRLSYVKKFIKISETIRGKVVDKELLRHFVADYLQQDGVFALHLLSKNTNDVVVSEVATALWDIYRTRRAKDREEEEIAGDAKIDESPMESVFSKEV